METSEENLAMIPRLLLTFALLPCALLMFSPARAEEWAADVPTGSAFPRVEATDQFGEKWTTGKLLGNNGLLFLFNRSAGW